MGRNKNKRFIFSLGRHLEAPCLEKKGSLKCCRANVIKYLVPCNVKFENVLGLPLNHTERDRLFPLTVWSLAGRLSGENPISAQT